jgi:ketosteroid isomerase-like protein
MISHDDTDEPHRAVVAAYLAAMQRGVEGEQELIELFSDEAEYVEPFSGTPRAHRGKAAIQAWFSASLPEQPPDIAITIERLDISGDQVHVNWVCDSSAFAMPSRGVDTYTVRDGRIHRLETVITQPPTLC